MVRSIFSGPNPRNVNKVPNVPVDRQVDVLIVGAGPVGLTLANDLVARGVSCRIIDQLAEPTRRSRAHALQSRTLEALDTIGLAKSIIAAAQTRSRRFSFFRVRE
jgi:2-polyprenyl-6-methoxyphenol hydroxylase-like FAD-dependent oxidoreductase